MAKHSLSDLSSMVLSTRKGLGLSAAMMLILFIIIVPMPLWALDTLIGISISSSVIMLMTAINIREPLMFSSYPGALLVTTLFRLALSLTTTRSILADGEAGKIVATFGQTVASGNLVVGMVLFALVTVVQMLVITKGA